MTPASAVPTASGPRQLRPTPDRQTAQPSPLPGRVEPAGVGARRGRGFRLGDATPSTRFLFVLVVASALLAVALAQAASHWPQFLQ